MKNLTLKFHADAGHGWLAAKRALLLELGVLHEVSGFSYQRGGMVYLEEDCDAAKLTRALGYAGIRHEIQDPTSYPDRSPIRSYEPFSANQYEQTNSAARAAALERRGLEPERQGYRRDELAEYDSELARLIQSFRVANPDDRRNLTSKIGERVLELCGVKPAEDPDDWMRTGICRKCGARAISVSECKVCGHLHSKAA